jgi:tRNA uridine 5-carboxymethylaminomethyl modification enzyme
LAHSLHVSPNAIVAAGGSIRLDGQSISGMAALSHPGISDVTLFTIFPQLRSLSSQVLAQLRNEGRYAGYLCRQEAEIRATQRDEATAIPAGFAYQSLGGLSVEMVEKLTAAQPHSLGAAARVQGVTPAALANVAAALRSVDRRAESLATASEECFT